MKKSQPEDPPASVVCNTAAAEAPENTKAFYITLSYQFCCGRRCAKELSYGESTGVLQLHLTNTYCSQAISSFPLRTWRDIFQPVLRFYPTWKGVTGWLICGFAQHYFATQICWREELPSSPSNLMGTRWDPAPVPSTGQLVRRGTGFEEGRARWSPTAASTVPGRADKYLTFRATLIRHQEEMQGFIPIKILLYLL